MYPLESRSRDDQGAAASSALTPPDVTPDEVDLAAWFSHLGRPDAPAAVRARVLRGCEQITASLVLTGSEGPGAELSPGLSSEAPPSVRLPGSGPHRRAGVRSGGGIFRRVPFGAWGLASAALLLLTLGAAVAIELGSPVAAPVEHAAPAQDVAGQVRIREDGTLTLFHDVETFDEVGLAPGELIADWGR